jgi:hypothetical protein
MSNNMSLTPNDIASVEDIGTISGNPVKLLKTKGGFHIAVGRKKGSLHEEALGAGSHSAIVKYNIEKQYSDFEPSMKKSEEFMEPVVEKHSHFLSDELRKSGHDIFSIQTGPSVEFHITRHNTKIAGVDGDITKSHLYLNELKIPKEFSKAMSGATVEKATSCKVGLMLRTYVYKD